MLYLPANLPAYHALRAESYTVAPYEADTQAPEQSTKTFSLSQTGSGEKGLCKRTVLLLNLMPQKAVTEYDIARTLAATGLNIELRLMKIANQSYKTTPQAHMDAFYSDFELYEQWGEQGKRYDALIVTGAPVEHLPFTEVRYWPALCHIMDWARRHTARTLYICWAAQAALYHFYGIDKRPLPQKMFGIFKHCWLQRGTATSASQYPLTFPMPNSRHTAVDEAAVRRSQLLILAESEESGIGIVASPSGHDTYIMGHLEYAADTLHHEYQRDLAKKLPIAPPQHYYHGDACTNNIDFSWQQAAIDFYKWWLISPHKYEL